MSDLEDPWFQDTCEPVKRIDCVVGTRFTDPCSCQSYYQCDTGFKVISRNCSTGLWWNHKENDCREQNLVHLNEICIYKQPWKSCNVSETRLTDLAIKCGGIHVPDTTQTPTTANPMFQDLCEPQDPPDCPNGKNFIDPCDCDSYYTCGPQNTISLSKCPDGTFWHHENGTCVNNDVIKNDTICSNLQPWDRCEVSANRQAVVARKCGYTTNASSAPEDNTAVIVGVVVGILLVLLIVIGGLVFWKKRKSLKAKKDSKGPVMNPEYFENRDSIYQTINDNDPMNELDPTYIGDQTLSFNHQYLSRKKSDGPPNEMAPIPSFRDKEQKIESDEVEYDNPGSKLSRLERESTNLTDNNGLYTIPLTNTPEDIAPNRYLQLSDTYRMNNNCDTDTVLNKEDEVTSGGYLEPDTQTSRPNSATRDAAL